jgi:hypothetical protein
MARIMPIKNKNGKRGAAKRSCRDGRVPNDERQPVVRVLQGVTRLVRGDTDASGRAARINIGTQPQHSVARVVVVRHCAGNGFNGHVLTARLVKNVSGGGGSTGEPRGDLHAVRISALHPDLGDHHQQKGRSQEHEIQRVEKEHRHLQNRGVPKKGDRPLTRCDSKVSLSIR